MNPRKKPRSARSVKITSRSQGPGRGSGYEDTDIQLRDGTPPGERDVTIRDLGAALRRFWPLAVGVFAVVMVAGALAAFLPDERYESTATLLVEPAGKDPLSFGAAEAVQYLIPPLSERIESDSFREQLRPQLLFGLDRGDVTFKAENEPGTGILMVTAESTRPETAELAATTASSEIITDPVSDKISASLLNSATPAESVQGGRRAAILLGSAVLGAIAAVFAAVGAQALRPRPSTAEFVSRQFELDVLGEIPYKGRLPTASGRLLNGAGPPEVVDAFQKLAVNLELLTQPNSVLAVTSWAEREGKTVVTAQLAWALASLGQEVTAIDCDLRNPALHSALGVNLRPGLADYKGGSIDEIVQSPQLGSLQVTAAGSIDRTHPAEAISEKLPAVLAPLEGRTVLIDTPPLFSPETTMIASQADAVILVVDARKTEPQDVRNAIRELELSGANLLGVVLNRTRLSKRQRGAYYQAVRSPKRASTVPGPTPK
jgi:succinoglycan biosynthesis transport protein ExoP